MIEERHALTKTHEQFVEDVKEKVGDGYEFLEEYIHSKTKIKVKHLRCDLEFSIRPGIFLSGGGGCYYCDADNKRMPKGERKVADVLDSLGVKFFHEYTLEDFDGRFDFYLPQYDAAIEFDGLHHFEPVENLGGEEKFIQVQHRDDLKFIFCRKNDIPLLRIPYWQLNQAEGILERFISKLESRKNVG